MHNNYLNNYSEMEKLFPESKILADEPMKKHTTFKIGGPVDIYVEPTSKEVVPIIDYLKNNKIPFMVIGNGSNLLVSDDGIEGAVICFGRNAQGITIEGTKLIADSGALLSTVANTAAKNGLTGLEFASGIPGSIGGAVYMNAGAYGGEMKDIIESVTVLDSNLEVKTMTVDELALSYRHSIFMENGFIVLSAVLSLKEGNPEEIKAQIDDIRQQRVTKQPLNFPSAGSTFKRPTGYFAGKLIDDTGLRGYSVGGAQVSEKHCGFVINRENATCADVLKLMSDVDERVFEKFGVHMEPEVRIIGRNIH
ncbi:MAG: UDP-N-acetylmuramate dehydrogenase [Pseudobutyrivibrio sp.]|nr:UDP-N-acetylmuramate dehydrogenase [Pseudobutyrivibrio sp.]